MTRACASSFVCRPSSVVTAIGAPQRFARTLTPTLFACAIACAFAATSARAAPIAIVDAKIELGDGTTIERGTVVIDAGKITLIGPSESVVVPAGAEKIDGKNRVVTPGLIATGSQVGIVEVSLESQTVDAHLEGAAVPAFRAIDGFNPRSPRIDADREQGVTTTIVSPFGSLITGQAYAVDMSGTFESVTGARRVAMFGAFGAGPKDAVGGARGGVILKLREIFEDARFYRANRAAFDRAASRDLALPRMHLEALFDVIDGKIPLVLDVHRASDILALLQFAKEQRVRVVISGGAEAWSVAPQLAAAKIPVIVTPSYQEPWGFEALHAREDCAAILEKAGVPVIISSGPTDNGTTRVRQEAGVAIAFGMSRAAAIRAITAEPARVFAIDATTGANAGGATGGGVGVGTLARGKSADFVVWSGDPLETTTVAEAVYIGGKKQSLDTRQRKLAEKYRTRTK